jgi:hypothetical protein
MSMDQAATGPGASSGLAGPEAPSKDEEPVIGGLRALVYVAVQAALAEGFPEERVLEHELLSEPAWLNAEEAWAQALSDSAESDNKLLDNYDATYNAYRWAFHRVIEPLEQDLAAWMNFSAQLREADDFDAFLLSWSPLPSTRTTCSACRKSGVGGRQTIRPCANGCWS